MAERTDFTTLGHAVEMHLADGRTVRLDMVDAEVMAERGRARDLAVALESEVARLRDQIIELPPDNAEDIAAEPYSREDIAELAESLDAKMNGSRIGRLVATLYREARRKLHWMEQYGEARAAVAERDAMLRDARALMRHDSVCAVNGPRWCWDQARQLSTCRACGAEYDVDRPGHYHDCDCGRDSLVARIDGLIGGESHE